MTTATQPIPQPATAPEAEFPRPLRVALVDDDRHRAAETAALLRAADSVRSVDIIGPPPPDQPWHPDCDAVVARPVVGGVEAATLLRLLRAAGLDAPFVVLSDGLGERAAVGLIRAGVDDVVGADELDELPAVLSLHRRRYDADRRRAEAEQAQRDLADRLGGVIDGTPNAVSVKTADGRYFFVNRAFEQRFGLSRRNVIGRRDHEVFADEALVRALDHHDGLAFGPQPVQIRDHVVAGGGTERYLRTLKYVTIGADGAADTLCTVVLDTTEQVQAQRDRARLESQLHQSQKLEHLGQLAGGIAHDFNNLLSAILHYNRFATERITAELGPASPAVADLEGVQRAAERASRLTQQLRSFSRNEVVRPETLDLGTAVGDLSDLLRPILGEQVELSTAGSPGLWPVMADRGKIEQVVVNLVVNARDAMPTGGQLGIDITNAVVDDTFGPPLVTLPPGRYVRLSVRDTGVGMAGEVVHRAFEPFFTTKAKGEGTGLGLATVYGIVRQAGGHVEIESELGAGTTVCVYLPAVDHPEDRAAASHSHQPSTGHETVLLVEDDEAVRELTARILESKGYRLLVAANGDEALRLAEDSPGPVDLLVTDVVMPGMVGRELAERLQHRFPALRVVYMSGYAEDLIASDGQLPAGVTLVEKPFSVAVLTARVREVLDA